MSEFLMLGWNVAIPEVDIGDDIFVVQDATGTLKKVQVKTARAAESKKTMAFNAQFSVSVKNLRNILPILVHYVFVVRHNDKWLRPVIIPQDVLLDHFEMNKVGSESNGNINFRFTYKNDRVICSNQDFTNYQDNFKDFTRIEH
ncbi:hypothetical protein C0V77_09390 [Emticicia sp. TH156]|nr:hypothetical protein C0V77_09390 [Emticicia sp. TH156]